MCFILFDGKSLLTTSRPVQQGGSGETDPLIGTSAVEIYCCSYENEKIFLVDTPGFNDTYRSDSEVLKDVAYHLSTLYTHKIKLAGMIYLHSIMDQKMTGSALKNLHMFEKLCGKNCLPNIILATTKWDMLKRSDESMESGIRRERELLNKQDFWGFMIRGGSTVMRHDGSSNSAWNIISYIMRRKQSVVLEIQRQMVDQRQILDDTAAGHFVQGELFKVRQQHERDLQDLKESMEHASKRKDRQLAGELQALKEKHEAEIAATYRDREGLKINLESLIEGRRQQYEERPNDLEAQRQDQDHQSKLQSEELNRTRTRLEEMERQQDWQNREHEHRIQELLTKFERQTEEQEQKMQHELENQQRVHREQEVIANMNHERELRHETALEFEARLEAAREKKREATVSLVKLLAGIGMTGLGVFTGSPAIAAPGLGLFRSAISNRSPLNIGRD